MPHKYSQYDIEKNEKISNFICGMTDLYAINIAEKISPGISDKLRFENI
jgi:dGTP triphosphohydrolase